MRTLVTGGTSEIGHSIIKNRLLLEDTTAATSSKPNIKLSDLDKVPVYQCDFFKTPYISDSLQAWINEGIDHLILNANTGNHSYSQLHDYNLETVAPIIQANIMGNLTLLHAVVNKMLEQNYGRIVFISSMSVLGSSGYTAYSASKAAIEAVVRTIATDYGKRNITANIIRPGIVKTQRTKRFWGLSSFRKAVMPIIPMNQFATPQQIADAVDFFCLKNTYATGQELNVAGGLPQINTNGLFKVGL